MSNTPRTDAVQEAAGKLPLGSIVVVPEGHPPSDPWELCRQMERELEIIRELCIKAENCEDASCLYQYIDDILSIIV